MDEIVRYTAGIRVDSPAPGKAIRPRTLRYAADSAADSFAHASNVLAEKAAALRKNRLMLALILLAASLFLTAFMSLRFSLEVSLDGQTIGTVASQSDFEAIVERVEARASGILGYDYVLVPNVGYSFAINERSELMNTGEIERALFHGIPEIVNRCAVVVNGEVVGVSDSSAELNSILGSMLEQYATGETVSAGFVEDVGVEYHYVSASALDDLDAISELLTGGEDGGGLLTVRTVETASYVSEVPYETVEYESDEVYEGDTRIITEGAAGASQITAEVVYVDGVEDSREVLSEVALSEPVAEVVAVGTAVRPLTASYGSYIWPTEGSISSSYGARSSGNHKGLDIANSYGTAVYAADGGTVTMAQSYDAYGLLVTIEHDNGDVTYYGHLSSIGVSAGDRVWQGQYIGATGSTGNAEGNHLHFEVRVGGSCVNPLNYLP